MPADPTPARPDPPPAGPPPAPGRAGDTLNTDARGLLRDLGLFADTRAQDGPADQPPPPLPAVPGYDIQAVLGHGGMGVVYKAVQTRLGRPVALKLVLGGAAASPAAVARFRAEAQAVAALAHPNVVQVYDAGDVAGAPYLAMELAPGGSLKDRLAAGPLAVEEAVRLVGTLARAVAAAHAAGVVHRDLKPANVLFAADGALKVADFGLAKRVGGGAAGPTLTGDVLGSPSYMAPEQAAGRPRDAGPWTDVWAVGVILYECLTGRPPFVGETLLETLDKARFAAAVPPRRLRPDVPRAVEAVCLRCLGKKPADRYPSAAAVAADLDRALTPPPAGRPRRGWANAAGLAACLAGAVAAGGLPGRPVAPPAVADGEPRGQPGPAPGPAAPHEPRLVALLVGVGRYPGVARAEPGDISTAASVDRLAAVLRRADPTARVHMLVQGPGRPPDRQPTAAAVRAGLAAAAAECGPGDTLIVSLNGEGRQGPGPGGYVFWPADAAGDPDHGAVGPVVTEAELAGLLTGCRAGVKLVLVDTGRRRPPRPAGRPGGGPELRAVGRCAVFFACQAGHECYEVPDLPGADGVASPFMLSVAQGLAGAADANGDGVVTVRELEVHAQRSTYKLMGDLNKSLEAAGGNQFEFQIPELAGTLPADAPVVRVAPAAPDDGGD